mgnify:CR=1 FL=1
MNGNWNSDNRCFNSRAHGGRDGATGPWPDSGGCFNSRAHGGRDKTPLDIWHLGQVSIHAPTGGATTSACAPSSASTAFQFTRPRGARLWVLLKFLRRLRFQFTRPRGARPGRFPRASQARVSIHAPTGGATHPSCRPAQTRTFQFTRPRGARLAGSASEIEKNGFNSRAHGGARHSRPLLARVSEMVSIHAPTGGATAIGHAYLIAAEFQFTRPRGARHRPGAGDSRRPRFNSRAHGGRDSPAHGLTCIIPVSIHAPTGGATGRTSVPGARRGFNSRAHGGRDLPNAPARFPARVSIHAPTGGATCRCLTATARATAFQFTRPRGARHATVEYVTGESVSIHAPTGGATRDRRVRNGRVCFNSRAHGGRDLLYPRLGHPQVVSIHAPTGGATRGDACQSRREGVSIHAPTGGATEVAPGADMITRFNSRAHGGRDSRGRD